MCYRVVGYRVVAFLQRPSCPRSLTALDLLASLIQKYKY
jgi:hypothetical protein